MGELSKELKEFIAGHFHSVIGLEVLLLLSEDRNKVWSVEAVARKLNLTPASVQQQLDALVSQGLLRIVDETTEARYCYHPSSDTLNRTIGQLTSAYATQRVAVLTIIFANPADKVRLFTETFRMIHGESIDDGVD